MITDRDLLCGLVAIQANLISSTQLREACNHILSVRDVQLVDFLISRGWLLPEDKQHIEYLVNRSLQNGSNVNENDPSAFSRPTDAETAAHLPAYEQMYDQLQHHATGGIGRVWIARDKRLGRRIALKELRSEYLRDKQLRNRFLREAVITGQLEHPNIVPIYDLSWRETEQPFYTMRFLSGETLSEASDFFHSNIRGSESESTEFQRLLSAFVVVCKTIAFAHSRGVLHRDIKGQNVVLGDFGEIVVLDWGLAKVLDEPGDSSSEVTSDLLKNVGLTLHGQQLGTPAYMAPEQARGRMDEVDRRTDVYGLGALLYEVLTGDAPFKGSNTNEILQKVQYDDPVPPRNLWPAVPPLLESACLKALAKDRTARFCSAAHLSNAIENWQDIELKRAEEALRASEALYHSLVETIPMNVWRKDTEGRFVFANEGFCKASGRQLADLVGKTDSDVFPVDLAAKYRADDIRVMSSGESVDLTEEHVTAAGEKLYVRVIKLPVRDARGEIVGTQGIFWDISEVKNLEIALDQATTALESLRDE